MMEYHDNETEDRSPEDIDSEADAVDLARRVRKAFRPSAPVATRDLFAGRQQQLETILEVIDEAGQHAVIYGERGVGKTSLAQVSAILSLLPSARYGCSGTDTFSTIWRGAFARLQWDEESKEVGFFQVPAKRRRSATDLLPSGDLTPETIRSVLASVTAAQPLVFFIDEFDRVEDRRVARSFADTIKVLSDEAVEATVVVVGVADDVTHLLAEHESIGRNLVQVKMPRMSSRELRQIIELGLGVAGMTINATASSRITQLSQGLPHYTHLLTQLAGLQAAAAERTHITEGDVNEAIREAVGRAEQSVRNAYAAATYSPKQANLYPQVLLACALAAKNEDGLFAAVDVREPLRKITGGTYDIPAYAQHLKKLSEDPQRGLVLQKSGPPRRVRYRFTDPQLQPYVVMLGVRAGKTVA